MDTATPAQPAAHETPTSATAANVQPIDPTRDIDAKTTTLWLVGSTIGVFLSIWVMAHVFGYVIQSERYKKVELAPTSEVDALRAQEDAVLSGSSGGKSIDQAIQELSRGK